MKERKEIFVLYHPRVWKVSEDLPHPTRESCVLPSTQQARLGQLLMGLTIHTSYFYLYGLQCPFAFILFGLQSSNAENHPTRLLTVG